MTSSPLILPHIECNCELNSYEPEREVEFGPKAHIIRCYDMDENLNEFSKYLTDTKHIDDPHTKTQTKKEREERSIHQLNGYMESHKLLCCSHAHTVVSYLMRLLLSSSLMPPLLLISMPSWAHWLMFAILLTQQER